jgi:CubicO group peptidase (beta-lactamase class C family)
MTGLAAQNMGLKKRGALKVGNFADLVIFDPETIIDKATPKNSTAISEGIESVIVNGRPVYSNNRITRYRPGKFLYGPGYNMEQFSDEITAYFNEYVKEEDPGVALMVRKDGRIIYQREFGLADLKTKEKIDPHSSFRMASVSKQFFAAAILICQEKGLLTVKDPITKYISNDHLKGITIENLVHHTSGIADYYEEALKTWDGGWNRNNADMIKFFKESYPTPYFRPGDQYQYCNPGYELMVTIIETVSGQKIYNFMDDHIFDPLGMAETQVFEGIVDFHSPQRVMGYTEKKGKFVEDDYTFLNGIIGAGGLYTSLNDYSKWLSALDDQELLSARSMEMMYEPAHLNDGSIAHVDKRTLKDFVFPDASTYSSYGYGWVLNVGDESTVSHSGSWVGFRNYVFRNLDSGLDIVMFSNRGAVLERWVRNVMKIIDKTITNL